MKTTLILLVLCISSASWAQLYPNGLAQYALDTCAGRIVYVDGLQVRVSTGVRIDSMRCWYAQYIPEDLPGGWTTLEMKYKHFTDTLATTYTSNTGSAIDPRHIIKFIKDE